jgi:hypothetical protein
MEFHSEAAYHIYALAGISPAESTWQSIARELSHIFRLTDDEVKALRASTSIRYYCLLPSFALTPNATGVGILIGSLLIAWQRVGQDGRSLDDDFYGYIEQTIYRLLDGADVDIITSALALAKTYDQSQSRSDLIETKANWDLMITAGTKSPAPLSASCGTSG